MQKQIQQHDQQGGFDHVETWIFDLDNTLYPAQCNLFDQIDQRMGAFISDLLGVDRVEAKRIQKTFFYEYGTTLRGLMDVHGIEPDAFLDFVHDIDHSVIAADEALAQALSRLEGRKLVFTNGSQGHAASVLGRLGIAHHFDGVFDIADADYVPKPAPEAYEKFLAFAGIDTRRAAMFEDIARNLEHPHTLGMTTVLVTSPENQSAAFIRKSGGPGADADHVHHVIDDLAGFLAEIVRVSP